MPPVDGEQENKGPAADGAASQAANSQDSQQSQGSQPAAGAAAPAAAEDAATSSGQPSEKGQPASGTEERPKSALDAVKKALGQPADAVKTAEEKAKADADLKAKGGDPAAQAAEDEKARQSTGKDDKERLSAEEWKGLPPGVRKRLGVLSTRATTAETKLAEIEPRLAASAEVVEQYEGLRQFVMTSGMSQEEFTNGLEIMRLIKQDPARAWDALQPIMEQLKPFVGEKLPADLQKEVDEGRVTEVRAKELVRARLDADRLERERQQRQTQDVERGNVETVQRARQASVSALDAYEKTWKASDPDYPKKSKQTWERMRSILDTKTPAQRMDQAVILEAVKQARKEVEEEIAGWRPAPVEKKPIPPAGGSGSTVVSPKSALDAARAALQGTAG